MMSPKDQLRAADARLATALVRRAAGHCEQCGSHYLPCAHCAPAPERTDRDRARALLAALDRCTSARGAWSTVDAVLELDRTLGRFARARATRRWGHRPCARVGLKTKPFHVVQTRKGTLSSVGRIIGGHRRIRPQS